MLIYTCFFSLYNTFRVAKLAVSAIDTKLFNTFLRLMKNPAKISITRERNLRKSAKGKNRQG
jgi:hypothetical protein